jgi:hypothetical protein
MRRPLQSAVTFIRQLIEANGTCHTEQILQGLNLVAAEPSGMEDRVLSGGNPKNVG